MPSSTPWRGACWSRLRAQLDVRSAATRLGHAEQRAADVERRTRAGDLSWADLHQAREEASRRVGLLSLVSAALMFVVLYSRYRSTRLALLIRADIPLALVGAVLGLWLAGQPNALTLHVREHGKPMCASR